MNFLSPLIRLSRLTDLVFAGSMTVMIFLLEFPTQEQIESDELFKAFLIDSLPRLYLFAITFVVVSVYWVKEIDQFNHLKDTNTAHIWLQLGFLAMVMLLPWSNALVEIRPDIFGPRLFYAVDIILIGLFSHFAWRTASNKNLLKEDTDPELIKLTLRQSLSEPAIAGVAIILALWNTLYFDLAFLLIPIAFVIQKKARDKLGTWLQKK